MRLLNHHKTPAACFAIFGSSGSKVYLVQIDLLKCIYLNKINLILPEEPTMAKQTVVVLQF